MVKIKSIIPNGTRDFTSEECYKREYLCNKVKDVFNKWGYKEVCTPTIEYYETFNYCTDTLKEEEMYKFFDNTGRILLLRPDMTIPVARMVSTKLKDLNTPIKLWYKSNIFRVNESMTGRKNEYLDCGIELIGVEDNKCDLEVLVTALEALKALGGNEFKLEIGNVNILRAAMEEMNLDQSEKDIIAELINKKSLTALKGYLDTLNIDNIHKEFLNTLPWIFGDYKMIDKCLNLSFSEEINKNIIYLKNLYNALEKLGYENYITVDMSMVPRVNYYSGIIFKGYIEGIGSRVLTGGRYDSLIENFGRKLPAIGFSIDIDTVLDKCNVKKESIAVDMLLNQEEQVDSLKKIICKIKEGESVNIVYK